MSVNQESVVCDSCGKSEKIENLSPHWDIWKVYAGFKRYSCHHLCGICCESSTKRVRDIHSLKEACSRYMRGK